MTAKQAQPDHDGRREVVLRAALRHVPFDGWGAKALRAGAVDLGLDPREAMLLFPGDGTDMIALHSWIADREMMEAIEGRDLSALKIRERIALAIRLRLERSADDREAVRRAVSVLSLPANAGLGARLLYYTVDAVWHAIGDTSTDWNFYSKRALLAGVYGSTVLFWLQDESPDHADTWAFLDRRIDDVMKVPRLTQRLTRLLDPLRTLRSFRPKGFRGAA